MRISLATGTHSSLRSPSLAREMEEYEALRTEIEPLKAELGS